MSLEITGKLLEVHPEQSGEGRNGTWRKRSFVIETPGQYPKKVCIMVWGDRIQLLENLQEGSELKVGFDLESREYNGRWYTDVKAWRIDPANPSNGGNAGGDASSSSPDDPFPDDMMSQGNTDDLPF